LPFRKKTLKDAGDKAKAEDKTAVEEKMKALKDIKDKDDVEAIKKAIDELSAAIQKLARQCMLRKTQVPNQDPATAAGQIQKSWEINQLVVQDQ